MIVVKALRWAHQRGLGLAAVSIIYALAAFAWAWLVWGHPYRPSAYLPLNLQVTAAVIELLFGFGACLFWWHRQTYLKQARRRT